MKFIYSLLFLTSFVVSIRCAEVANPTDSDSQKRFWCNGCDFKAKSAGSFSNHRKKIKNGYPFHCKTCGKRDYASVSHTDGSHTSYKRQHRFRLAFYCYYCIGASTMPTANRPQYNATNDKLEFETTEELMEHVNSTHFKQLERGIYIPIADDHPKNYWDISRHRKTDSGASSPDDEG